MTSSVEQTSAESESSKLPHQEVTDGEFTDGLLRLEGKTKQSKQPISVLKQILGRKWFPDFDLPAICSTSPLTACHPGPAHAMTPSDAWARQQRAESSRLPYREATDAVASTSSQRGRSSTPSSVLEQILGRKGVSDTVVRLAKDGINMDRHRVGPQRALAILA